jgi:hypothetical protein
MLKIISNLVSIMFKPLQLNCRLVRKDLLNYLIFEISYVSEKLNIIENSGIGDYVQTINSKNMSHTNRSRSVKHDSSNYSIKKNPSKKLLK